MSQQKHSADKPQMFTFPATGVAGNRGADFVQHRDYFL
jgi:hypothetical protein